MPSKRNFLLRILLCLTIIVNLALVTTSASDHKINWEEFQQEAIDLFIQYLKIDTTNPPGNEIRATEFFAGICKREGIEHQVFEPFPGRGSIRARLRGDGSKCSIIRNTISITMLRGSNKINIIPPAAYAEIDTRLTPGEKLDRWIAELREVIKDDSIKIEPIMSFEANASLVDSELVKTVAAISKQRYPEAIIYYPVLAGFTDSHYFRELGVKSYGFSPFVAPPLELGGGYHGNDERIGKKAYVEGLRFFYEVVERLAR